jgi:hypothetical protein
MNICEKIFERVTEHLAAVNYNGPVALSCDDSKLFGSSRLYFDSNENKHYYGAVGGLILVPNPDDIKTMMSDPTVVKATKVSPIICLSSIFPGSTLVSTDSITKIIPNDLDANSLLIYLEQIVDGLLPHNVKVTLYSADGTETERSLQRLMASSK